MLVRMLLVVGRSSPRSPRGRAWRKSAGSAALRRACLFFVSVALFCHTINYIFCCHLCVFLCASAREYGTAIERHSPRHDNVCIRKTTGVQPS